MQISAQIKKIDLIAVVKNSGVDLKHRGLNPSGLCPFHTEKNPSFFVFRGSRFRCFGCGEGGDAVDFIQKLYGLSFGDALKFLGIDGKSYSYSRRAIAERRELIRAKKRRIQRERDLIHTLAILLRATYQAKSQFTNIERFNESAEILDPLAFWTFCHDVLSRGSKTKKDQVVAALADMPTLRRQYLWSAAKFDYGAWVNNFLTGGAHNEPARKRITITFSDD
jgi:hypothetical protein